MIVFPNAKINIGLNVIEKRQDGFHNIESCFFPIPWKDALEVVEAGSFSFSSSGIAIPGTTNIVELAYNLLRDKYNLPPIAVHLHKNIPIGAGLGGGSADGAFMLSLLNQLFKLSLSNEQLKEFAGKLGSDCPFFIDNKPAFVEGTGNIFSSINLDLSGNYLAVNYPDIHVDTASAYKNLVPAKPEFSLKSILEAKALNEWAGLVKNDFEKNADPEIIKVREELYQRGAIYASMSGSGSAVYGIYKKMPDLNNMPGTISIFKL